MARKKICTLVGVDEDEDNCKKMGFGVDIVEGERRDVVSDNSV